MLVGINAEQERRLVGVRQRLGHLHVHHTIVVLHLEDIVDASDDLGLEAKCLEGVELLAQVGLNVTLDGIQDLLLVGSHLLSISKTTRNARHCII